jgi:hypothetical protein
MSAAVVVAEEEDEEEGKEVIDDDDNYERELEQERVSARRALLVSRVSSIYPSLAYPTYESGEDAALWIRYFYKVDLEKEERDVRKAAANCALRGCLLRLAEVAESSGYDSSVGLGDGDSEYMFVLWWCTGVVWALLDSGRVGVDELQAHVESVLGGGDGASRGVGRSVLMASAWLAGTEECRVALHRWRAASDSDAERAMIDALLGDAGFPIDETPVNTVDIGWKMELMAGYFQVSGSLAVLQHFVDLVRFTKSESIESAYDYKLFMANAMAKQKITVLALQHRLARDFFAGALPSAKPICVDKYTEQTLAELLAKVDEKISSALCWPEPTPK